MISVIVPVYKVEKYLHRCVDSILAQSYTDFELLLINDGSPDSCGAICDEYAEKDSRVRVFHKENGGVSSARNLGLDNARGEWVTFVDADDYIEEGFLNIPCSAKEDLLIQNYTFWGDSDKNTKFVESVIDGNVIPNFIAENLHKEWLRVPWAKFFKTTIIKKYVITFPDGVKIGEDAIFVQDYLLHTESVRCIASGNYMYNCNNDYGKYKLSPQEAVAIFHRFIDNYKKLEIKSIRYLDFFFNFYWGLIHPKEYGKEKRIWYTDEIVRDVYKTINVSKNLKWRVKYNLFKLLS